MVRISSYAATGIKGIVESRKVFGFFLWISMRKGFNIDLLASFEWEENNTFLCIIGFKEVVRRSGIKDFILFLQGELVNPSRSMASNVSYVQAQIPLLTSKNYDTWAIKMKTLFRSQGLTDIVEKGFEESDDEFDLNDQQRREL